MAAGNFILYDSAKLRIGDGTIDLDTHTFKIQLHSSSYTPNRATQAVRADLTNELSTANGYTATGATLGSVTYAQTAGTATWDAADPSWTASGGSLVASYAVIYDDTPTSPADPLVGYCLLDTAPADITATTGQVLTIQFNASGIFTLSGATS
jgi:hypothetical protein